MEDPGRDGSKVIINRSLQKIAKGAVFILISTIIGTFLGFLSRLIIIRGTSQNIYGLYSLCIMITGLVGSIAFLGMGRGVMRFIAYYRGKKDELKIKSCIFFSFFLTLFLSFILTFVLFIFSDLISIRIFHDSNLSLPLKIFSFSIPFYVIITLVRQIFRGFDRTDAEIFFNKIGRNLIFVLFLIPLFLFPLGIRYVAYAYLVASFLTVVFLIFFMKKKLLFKPNLFTVDLRLGKRLLLFFLPLMGGMFSSKIMTWADTFLLGVYKTSDVVGLYYGAVPLAQFIPFFLGAMIFIYTPVVSTLYAKKNHEEIKNIYPVVTKWAFLMGVPILFVFLLFPKKILIFLFGIEYVDAWLVLIIVSVGSFIHTLLGANAQTLTSFGYTKIQFYAMAFAALVNIVLNVIL